MIPQNGDWESDPDWVRKVYCIDYADYWYKGGGTKLRRCVAKAAGSTSATRASASCCTASSYCWSSGFRIVASSNLTIHGIARSFQKVLIVFEMQTLTLVLRHDLYHELTLHCSEAFVTISEAFRQRIASFFPTRTFHLAHIAKWISL
mgnify:CR=1 FL=1